MLNEIYKQVKRCLNTVPGLQGVEWFNNQYQGIIHAEPVVFVEFPEPVVPDPVTKTTRVADLKIRVHVVSSIIADTDNSVPDGQITGHEGIAKLVLESLEGQVFSREGQEIKPLKFSTWEHYHKWTGWMVTFIDFKTRMPI